MQIGQLIKVTTTQERKDGTGKVTWIVQAEVTKVSATEIEWKTVKVVAFTAHGEDAPISGAIARAAFPFLKKTGRVEIL